MSSSVSVYHVQPVDLPEAWGAIQGQVRRGLTKACGDRMTEAGLLKGLADERYFLWLAHIGEQILGGVIFTFVKRPKGRCMIVLLSAGKDVHGWRKPMQRELKEHAERHDCYCIEAIVRDAGIEILKGMGWRRKATVMEIQL